MKIYLVRHGETEWNAKGRIQGHTDVPLSKTGRQMAKDASRQLVGFKFGRIYSSPLNRAMETATLMFGVDKSKLILDKRLMEMNYGVGEGQNQPLVTRIPLFRMYNYFNKPEKYVPSRNGESFEEFRNRIVDFLENEIAILEDEIDTVVIAAHGALIREIVMWINQIPRKDLWNGVLPKNCSLTTLELKNGKFKVLDESITEYNSL